MHAACPAIPPAGSCKQTAKCASIWRAAHRVARGLHLLVQREQAQVLPLRALRGGGLGGLVLLVFQQEGLQAGLGALVPGLLSLKALGNRGLGVLGIGFRVALARWCPASSA